VKVLVTGASGFFGSAIVRELRAHGHEVHGAARRPDGVHANIALDITDPDAVQVVLASGFDGVVHSAALAHVRLTADDARRADAVNAVGASNVAAAAASTGVAHYVFISSVMVYGDFALPALVTEEAPLHATGAYGAAKIAAERATLAVPGTMRRTVLRMATMYAPDWLFNVRKRVAVPMIGKWCRFSLDPATPRYSLCARDGGAAVVRASLESRVPAATMNVADDHVYSQREIAAAVASVEGPALTLRIPLVLPRCALAIAQKLAPAPMAEAARSRYWKFCERNVYSTERLAAAGLRLPAQMLDLAQTRPA
jgi:nucleoside-diphosphate-sugar epimerase